jgi:putative endonuclease
MNNVCHIQKINHREYNFNAMAIPHLGPVGQKGEELARKFLEKEGLIFRQANLRVPGGEIDLLMEDKTKRELVFVEVRTRTNSEFGSPEESLSPNKRHVLKRSIAMHMQNYPWNTNYRLDLVAIMIKDGNPKITHYKDIFLT